MAREDRRISSQSGPSDWSRHSLQTERRRTILFTGLPLPAHSSSITIGACWPPSRERDLRGRQPFIGDAVLAGGGDHWARPHARLLARAGDRAGSPAQSSGSTGG
jgi:hypothetical protein